MCGIAGVISSSENLENEKEIYINMKNALKKRGPDQDGIYISGNAALVHTRLAIIDIEKGRQPMSCTYGQNEYVIVYNGMLYNMNETRSELIAKGHTFNSQCDTEVILKSYVEWGEACVDKLNGIFAFAVWDKSNNSLFIARDRIGVKPFFYSLMGDTFIFGSEIGALFCHPKVKPEIDEESITEIMLIGPGRTPGYGVFKNISELPPAHCGYFKNGNLTTKRYWDLKDKEHTESFEETAEKVRFLMIDSIQRQLVSDVPLCTLLSGGLDSSIITSIADKYYANQGLKLQTFTVNYKDNYKFFKAGKFQPNSDYEYVKCMNEYLNGENQQFWLDTPDLVDALYEAVDARGLPGMADVDSSLLLFSREVKKQATVALSGECSDEIFGGYPWYYDEQIRNIDGFPWAQTTDYRAKFIKDEFINTFNPQKYVYDKYLKTISDTSKCDGISKDEARIKELVKLNFDWFMQTLLDRNDRMCSYNGIEIRVPFCDYRIAEYLYQVPWEYKNYNGYEKGLLRYAMRDLLPDKVLWRKKSPYPKTHNPSYMNAVSNILTEIINDNSSPMLQFVNKDALVELLKADNPTPWYGQLMTIPQTIAYFIQINYWLSKFKIKIV